MPRYSRLAEFARTRGARDKRPRKRRNDLDLLDKEYKGARTNELRTRSIANLGRTLNSVGNSVREIRLTAKWLGIDPSRKRGNDPMSIVRNVRSGSDAGNSLLRLGRGITGTRSRSSRVSLDGGGLIRSATLITGRSGGLFGMRSLNSMIAEFGRGKDKKKRRRKIIDTAKRIGAAALPAYASTVVTANMLKSSPGFTLNPAYGLSRKQIATGVLGGLALSVPTVYALRKLKENQNKKRSPLSRIIDR